MQPSSKHMYARIANPHCIVITTTAAQSLLSAPQLADASIADGLADRKLAHTTHLSIPVGA